MSDTRSAVRADTAALDELSTTLRALGARAHQLRAALRAADHYGSLSTVEDTDTATWLISSALDLAQDGVADIDSLARGLKDKSGNASVEATVAELRVRAHQLLAATRAADHFLEQESHEDRDTGSWLIATARHLADKMTAGYDDSVLPQRRPAIDKSKIEPHDPALARRVNAATAPLRGAAGA